MRPRLLDLFCGAGGCSVGYDRAGFDVVGVDIEPHPDYPFELVVGDAMEYLADVGFLNQFDAVHASPPCPFYSTATIDSARDRHPDLVPPTLAALRAWGGVWVVENVPGAPMPGAVVLCGGAMGLPRIKRHRLFLSSEPLMSPGCACTGAEVVGVHGGKRGWGRNAPRPDGTSRGPARTDPRRGVRGHGHRLDDQAWGRLGRHPAELHRVHRRAAHRPARGGRLMSITIPPRVNGPNGYDPAAGGYTAKGCGTQQTETVDGHHGRRCAAHPPRPEQPAGGEQA